MRFLPHLKLPRIARVNQNANTQEKPGVNLKTKLMGVSLKTKLTGVMLLTVSSIAAIVHFPWVYTSHRNVENMVIQLNRELMRGTQNEFGNLFQDILAAKQLIKGSLDRDLIQLNEATPQSLFYLDLLQTQENFTWVQFGFANGDYLGAQRQNNGLYSIIKRQWDDSLGELGEAGTALAAKQAERAKQFKVYEATQNPDSLPGEAQKSVEIYRFQADNTWKRIRTEITSEAYFAPIRPFYKKAIANPREDVWTDVYVYVTDNAVGLDASVTYQRSETEPIQGVISISFELRHISEYLASLKEANQGAVFIIDRQEHFIAASNPDALADTFQGERGTNLMQMADDIKDPLLPIAYRSLKKEGITVESIDGIKEFSYDDPETRERYYVAFAPLREMSEDLDQLDWVVGTVTPEAVFLKSINRRKNRLLIGILLFLGIGAVAVVILSDRAIARPILTISAAAEEVEAGNFSTVVKSLDKLTHRQDELGRLSRIFQEMAREVCAREQKLKRQLQALKIEINESRRNREVREIVETDFFQDLKIKAQKLRNRTTYQSSKFTEEESCGAEDHSS